jgi:Dolichyl-phosphate-mannose-protein mannosyltransferase
VELSLCGNRQLVVAVDPDLSPTIAVRATKLARLVLLERVVAVLLTSVIVTLLVVRANHAGGLWRDEAGMVQLARMPSVSDVFRNFQHEAFPPAFPLTIRAYTNLFDSSDDALRIFGGCVGCLVVGAFWINARMFRNDAPLVALGLLSLNSTFFEWGTTLRGYGLGSALAVLMFGSIGTLIQERNLRRTLSALLICVAAVQVLLYNCVLLVAIGGAAAILAAFRKRFKEALAVLGVCVIAIVSFLPYLPAYIQARDWNILVRGAPTFYSLWKHFEVALGNPGYSLPAIWYCLAIGLAGVLIFRINVRKLPVNQNAVWFALIACGLGVAHYFVFLRVLGYTTSTWYYLALICVIIASLDLIASKLCTTTWLRLARIGFAVAALIIAPFANWSAIMERLTNIDIVAQTVATEAKTNDLIIVTPWQFGISFQRYYHGPARWVTIPNITDHQLHRYDLVKAKMLSDRPIDDSTEAIRKTLLGGNRVWFAPGINLPDPGKGPLILPPAPASRFGWDCRAYVAGWWQQLSIFALSHAKSVNSVDLTDSGRVNDLEQLELTTLQGWQ